MKTEISIERLLLWRLRRDEAEAPPAPPAWRLLELARPWRETWPERFQLLVERLGKIQVAYGHAMAEPRRAQSGYPVPVLIVHTKNELETFARVLYLDTCDGRLHLRFLLNSVPEQAEPAFEVTFISVDDSKPLFSAHAALSLESEYRLDSELPVEVAKNWKELKVTERMPFRLILRPLRSEG